MYISFVLPLLFYAVVNDELELSESSTCQHNNWRRGSRMAKAILGQMEPFELQGGDWILYAERMEQFFISNRIEEDSKKVATLLTVIGDKVYALLRNLVAPVKPATKSFRELVEVKKHLKPKPPVIAERFKFHRRNQQEGETIAQYLAVLRELT